MQRRSNPLQEIPDKIRLALYTVFICCMRFSKMAVAVDQHHGFMLSGRSQIFRFQSYAQLCQTNIINSLKMAFEAASVHRSFSTPCLSKVEDFDATPRIEVIGSSGTPSVHALVVEAATAMASGINLKRASSGLGGAYILHSQKGVSIAVAKPIYEESLAVGNLLGKAGFNRSVRMGETGIREAAAYLLDHGGFAGVPPTTLVKISHDAFDTQNIPGMENISCRIASLQSFIDHDYDAGEFGPSGFSVSSVHRIGILDARLLNLDRHAGNILVKKQKSNKFDVGVADLVPIDHGLCLPEWLDDPYFEWLHWPQASIPFSESEVEYITSLDPFDDAELLRAELPLLREASIRILIVCTIFLKQAVSKGLCLADIGEIMSRDFCNGEGSLSSLESLCAQAMAKMPKLHSLQFDAESEDRANGVFELPQLLHSHPKIPTHIPSSPEIDYELSLPFEGEEEDEGNSNQESGYESAGDNVSYSTANTGSLGKSLSFSGGNHSYEGGCISFGEMSEEEWMAFLDIFEKLLPELLESSKGTSSKLKMGTSCSF